MKCSRFYKTISVLILSLVLSIFLYLLFSDRHGGDKPAPIAVNNYMSSTDTCSTTSGTGDSATSGDGATSGGSTGGGGSNTGGGTTTTTTTSITNASPTSFDVTGKLSGSESVRISATDVDGEYTYEQTAGSIILQADDIIWYASRGFIVKELDNNQLDIIHVSVDTFMDTVTVVDIADVELDVHRNVLAVQHDAVNTITLQAGENLENLPLVLIPDLTSTRSHLILKNNSDIGLKLQLPYPYHVSSVANNGESEQAEISLAIGQEVVIKPAGTHRLEFSFVI